MFVFRIEKHNVGPYYSGFLIEKTNSELHQLKYGRPPVVQDILYKQDINKIIIDSFYGFDNAKKLINWFKDFFELLKENDYKIICYQIDQKYVKRYKYQCLFIKNKAKKVQEISFEDIYDYA